MRVWQQWILVMLSVLLLACSDQADKDEKALAAGELRESTKALVLDGSSEESFNASLEDASAHMTQIERDVFSVALLELMLFEVNRLDNELANSDKEIAELPSMYKPFDGLTVGEVVARSEAIKR